ncbi:Gfo/Idh/MocA family protein [Salisediminibacterium halotolerans]|uniref:Predicted dehydrogenase n=1 Tax=Salisediminibacterium halotolerans TaxID=517425 RepID=A0A1H9U4E4_9BACI|nr:Gfo/Idh/MocA family oxidoreductase [Salisediminibacterium haloalkalitolerans]SES04192.1 Predicted dehydrogenase [Salisediminibacterium haloalkalitolerans]
MRVAATGTGFIVERFLAALQAIDSWECRALYSRSREKAEPLADKYEIAAIHTSLASLAQDGEIDLVYIASPNSLHTEQALSMMEAGKHVICEKPLAANVSEAKKMIKKAAEQGVYLFEAITTIHLPNYRAISEMLAEIGDIKLVQCNYSQYSSRYDKFKAGEIPNVFNPQFAGGALQDINTYNFHFIAGLFNKPEEITYTANRAANGIDTSGIAVMRYSGFAAECTGAKDCAGLNFALIQGDRGWIHVENGVNGCERIHLHQNGETKTINEQTEDNLLIDELRAFQTIMNSKDIKRYDELTAHSLTVMEMLTEARMSAGIYFPADEKGDNNCG